MREKLRAQPEHRYRPVPATYQDADGPPCSKNAPGAVLLTEPRPRAGFDFFMEQLAAMGFADTTACQIALEASGGNVEAALEMLM